MATDADRPAEAGDDISPKNTTSMEQTISQSLGPMNNPLDAISLRADPDAQATVTDFLDFTEYLPSDMMRSLTLIGQLDQTYLKSSSKVDELTTAWSQLPSLPAEGRPSPVQLRADISEKLGHAVSSRTYAHAEATRMAENVNRHYTRAKFILSKLQTMLENYPPPEEQKSPVASKSPQTVRVRAPARTGEDGQKIRRQRVPRITVPGEVLAPYEIDLNFYSDDSDVSSSSEESDTPPRRTPARSTPGAPSRIRLLTKGQKVLKPPKTPKTASSRPPRPVTVNIPGSTAGPPVILQPPPENAVPGSVDAPWLQLTPYELARLRKRMKKNAVWTPSETMINRELKVLGRGQDAYWTAKKKAEEEGRPFDNNHVPTLVVDDESGQKHLPEGAISLDAAEALPESNKGMKLNEAKKLKREAMAKQAAEEAEAQQKKFTEAAMRLMGIATFPASTPDASSAKGNGKSKSSASKSTQPSNKRKRDAIEGEAEGTDAQETPNSKVLVNVKRVKTETPVPPPQLTPHGNSQPRSTTPIPPPLLTPSGHIPQSTTPVPIPIPPQSQESAAAAKPSPSPSATPAAANVTVTTTTIPTKPPAETQTPIPPPVIEKRKSTTPILPPVRDHPKRETRGDVAKKMQQQPIGAAQPSFSSAATPVQAKRPTSRGPTLTPELQNQTAQAGMAQAVAAHGQTQAQGSRRPPSRGKAMSQEPVPTLAADRPRRASTARNTPAPEAPRQNKRKRPAPGVVSTTSSGGNSAVGKRKAAPKRKARAKKDKHQAEEMEEVDDEGNPIDPDEARYCLCNRVSFGTMIQCDNMDVSFEKFLLSPQIDSGLSLLRLHLPAQFIGLQRYGA